MAFPRHDLLKKHKKENAERVSPYHKRHFNSLTFIPYRPVVDLVAGDCGCEAGAPVVHGKILFTLESFECFRSRPGRCCAGETLSPNFYLIH